MSNVVPMQEIKMPAVITPMEMLDRAIAGGAGIETLEKLMALQERYESNQARKAYDNAMASAKAEIPVIGKNREVDFTSQKGRTNYRYEDLAEVARVVSPILAKYGLSYRFRVTSQPSEPVTVTCVVSHRDGHAEETTLCAGRDDSGNKNSIQAIGSTLTYLQRMTLKAALGIAASTDDDGKASETVKVITQKQVDSLVDLLEAASANKEAFLEWLGVGRVEDIPADRFNDAVNKLHAKIEKQRAGA